MILRLPLNNRPIYCSVTFVGVLTPGCGPSGFASGRRPLPLATSSFFPSGVIRTEVGYQPVGMKPRDRLRPTVLTSKTARELLSALATNKVCSSGDKARLLGVDPGGACG